MRIASPVFSKEMGQLAVSRKPVVMKLILLSVLFAGFLVTFLSIGSISGGRTAELGRTLFGWLVNIELFAMAVFTPIVTAGMVCGEKESNTLGLLLLTRLKSWNIVQDKGLSRIAFMLFICVVTLPFMFAALLFGGVEAAQIVSAAANIFAVILLCGAYSLLSSTLVKKFSGALAAAYCMIVLHMVVFPFVAGTVVWGYVQGMRPTRFMEHVSPFVSAWRRADPYSYYRGLAAPRSPSYDWTCWSNLAIALCVYMLVVSIASRLLKRIAFYDRLIVFRSEPSLFVRQMFDKPLPFHLASLLHRRGDVGRHAVFWKESNLAYDNLKTPLYRIMDMLCLAYVVPMIVALFVDRHFVKDVLTSEETYGLAYVVAFALTTLFTAILAAASFAREREAGTLDVLLSTRLKARDVVLGKFFGVVRAVAPLAAVPMGVFILGCLWCAFVPRYNLLAVGLLPVGSTAYLMFVIAIGMNVSAWQKTTGKAVGWALAALFLAQLMLHMAGVFLEALWANFCYNFRPDWAIGEAIFAFDISNLQFWILNMLSMWLGYVGDWRPDNCDEGKFVLKFVVFAAVYLILTFALLDRLIRSFDRRMGRQK